MVATKKKRKKQGRKQKKRSWQTFVVMALISFMIGGVTVFLVLKPEKAVIQAEKDVAGSSDRSIQYEEPGVPDDEPVTGGKGSRQVPSAAAPRDSTAARQHPPVAIVIDDMGYNRKTCEALIDLDLNLSFAFLPFGPHGEEQIGRAKRQGRDILLHFPMEAVDPKWQPDGNTVTIDMDRAEIGAIFTANLDAVPGAVGINNHMGSRFTQNGGAMRDFLALVRGRGLFFLDSRTSRNSVGESLAAEMGVRTARRDVFLDNVRETQAIIVQLRKLLALAEREGRGIAIGHPYPETLRALQMLRGEINQRAKVVGVGELVR